MPPAVMSVAFDNATSLVASAGFENLDWLMVTDNLVALL